MNDPRTLPEESGAEVVVEMLDGRRHRAFVFPWQESAALDYTDEATPANSKRRAKKIWRLHSSRIGGLNDLIRIEEVKGWKRA